MRRYSWADSSITFEKTPSDYAILKIHTLPETGGDTLWASAYEAYDRLSTPYKKFLEGLTAVHSAQRFNMVAARHGRKVRTDARGAPDNVGDELRAIHPIIRTNPVTGWKGLFVNKEYLSFICIDLT
jgi:alpha-ketoglutarate-dependent taurine dioxygenase